MLAALDEHDVDFVVVGGTAAVLAGVFYATDDLDVVVDYEPGNLARLATALAGLEALYFDPAGRRLAPDAERLAAHRLNLLVTRLGRLDVLRAIGRERTYAELLARSSIVELEGVRVRTADLEVLIEAKEVAGRDKDRDHLRLLREALRLRRQAAGEPDSP